MGGKPVIVGLLGGVASGKSTVAAFLGRLGAKVIDADRIAHEVLDDLETLAGVVAIVGPAARDGSGRADRRAIADLVFGDPAKLSEVEELIHPEVRRRISEEIDAAGDVPAVVLDAPLLLEGGLQSVADTVVFVAAPPEARAGRAERSRGWAGSEVAEREARQAPLEEKRRLADFVIENDGDLGDLERRVRELHRRIVGST